MQPIGPLMREHRLIERMISAMSRNLKGNEEKRKVDSAFIDIVIDFLRIYADRCHHGKEEDILFRDLAKKQLSVEHMAAMEELVSEHAHARQTVSSLSEAKERYIGGDASAANDVFRLLGGLVDLYPRHIEKEDKHFFHPCMAYFTRQEMDQMLEEFQEFDGYMIHEKYAQVVEKVEGARAISLGKWRCTICNYIYDPQKGDPDNGVNPGTPFKEIPESWRCPICGAPKEDFEKLE